MTQTHIDPNAIAAEKRAQRDAKIEALIAEHGQQPLAQQDAAMNMGNVHSQVCNTLTALLKLRYGRPTDALIYQSFRVMDAVRDAKASDAGQVAAAMLGFMTFLTDHVDMTETYREYLTRAGELVRAAHAVHESTKPVVGGGATEFMYSDSHAYTVKGVSADGKIVFLLRDLERVVSGSTQDGSASWIYFPGEDRSEWYAQAKLQKDGTYKMGSSRVLFGFRSAKIDPSF